MNSISIIIPACNEADSISQVIDEINKACAGLTYEIIVVDDGSTDGTGEVVRENKSVKLVQHHHNRGYGRAIKSGVRVASYELICITDADSTYPNNRIPDLLARMQENEYDMIVGARPWDKIERKRKLAKQCIQALSEFLVEQKIPDLNSGLRIFRKDLFEKCVHLLPDGFSLTSTITLIFISNGNEVFYEPIDYYKRVGSSKIKPIQDTLNFIQLILRTTLLFNPLKIFLRLDLFLIIVSILLGLFQAIFLRNITTITVLMLLSGIQVLAIGLLADLIERRMRPY